MDEARGRTLRQELIEGTRSERFRTAAGRQAIMLAGVFALGWPAHEIAVFFLLEAFLFLSLRAATEISLDERYGAVDRRPWHVAAQIALHLLVTVPFMAFIVGMLGVFAVLPFAGVAWETFVREGIREPSFLGAVALLAASIVYDTGRFARRIVAGRGPEERAQDDEAKWLALARPFVLVIASLLLGVAAQAGLGPRVLAVAVAATMLYVEAVPQRVARLVKPNVG